MKNLDFFHAKFLNESFQSPYNRKPENLPEITSRKKWPIVDRQQITATRQYKHKNLILDARSLVLEDIADPFWNGIESKFLNESISEKRKQILNQ